jgi:hypothetical protein
MTPILIYCGNGNPRFATIAVEAGYRYGCQLPGTVMKDATLDFADQDWKSPDRTAYMKSLAQHKPRVASVLDWEHDEQLNEVLGWAEDAAQYVSEGVIIIPKVINEVHRIPKSVGGKRIILGYSVPTKFGATNVPCWEFAGWPVHLLGGSPHRQMREWMYMSCMADVVSVDGNMTQKMAINRCQYWCTPKYKGDHWRKLTMEECSADAMYEAFRRSCENVSREWIRITTRKELNSVSCRQVI